MTKVNRLFNLASIQKICVLYIIVWSVSPFMSIDMIYRYLGLAFFALWFLIALIRKIKFDQWQLIAIVFAMVVAVCGYLETESFKGVIRQISFFMLVICFIIASYYRDKWDELKGIVPLVLVLLIVFNIRSAQAVITDPTVARLIVRNDESIYPYLRSGVGGYSLIYPQVVIFPALLMWVLQSYGRNNLKFTIGLLWLGSYIVFIANAGYSTAIVATVISTFIMFFYKWRSIVPAFAISIILFIGVLMVILYVEPVRNALLQFFDGTAVAKKINDLVASSDSGESEGSIASRVNAYSSSLKALLQYPLIGALWRGGGGGHSAFLDSFVKYGALGGVVFSKLLYSTPSRYRKDYNRTRFIVNIANGSLIALLFVSVLDSLTYEFYAVIFIVQSAAFEEIIEWKKIERG